MSALRGCPALLRAALLETLRSRATLFWTLAFPLFFLFVFGGVFGRGRPALVSYLMPGLLTITVLSSSFMGLSLRIVTERETGLLRRYRVTPVSALAVVLARALATAITLCAGLGLQLAVARLVFGIQVAGSLLELGAVLLLVIAAFVPLGLLVGSLAPDTRSAPVLANLAFFPMLFLSGAALPFAALPGLAQRLARLLPATYAVEALSAVVVRGEPLGALASPLLVLVGSGLLALALNALLFRWESTDGLDRWRVAGTLAALAGLAVASDQLSPALAMAQPPRQASALSRAGEEMGKLAFLAGRWQGEGQVEMVPGQRQGFAQSELVETRMSGRVLHIEGHGSGPEGAVVHEALATVSWDDEEQAYRFCAYRGDGQRQDAEGKLLGPGHLQWGFRDQAHGVQVRFTVRLTAEGRWHEIGEASLDGKAWRRFLEMTLARQE